MNKEKMYLERIDVLKKEVERLNKQLNKPNIKVGIGVKK